MTKKILFILAVNCVLITNVKAQSEEESKRRDSGKRICSREEVFHLDYLITRFRLVPILFLDIALHHGQMRG